MIIIHSTTCISYVEAASTKNYQGHPALEGSGHSHDHDDYGSHSHSGFVSSE